MGWNVYKGGRTDGVDRIGALLAVLGSLQADVVVLSEITAATHPDWVEGLRSLGLTNQASTVGEVTAEQKYALVIASRSHLVVADPPADCPYPQRVLVVELGDLFITGIHPPWNEASGGGAFYTWLRSAVAPLRGRRAMIIGDFNADPAEPVSETAELGEYFGGLLRDGWRHALHEADPTGDHPSTFWPDVGPRVLDHCLLAPGPGLELESAHIVDRAPGVPMPHVGFDVADGALSDHRPIVVDVR